MNQLSAGYIDKNGLMTLPNNIENLSTKKQKDVVLALCLEEQKLLLDTMSEMESDKIELKRINALIKASKEGKNMLSARERLRQGKNRMTAIIEQRNGVMSLAARLGIDVTKELRAMLTAGAEE
jgi:hypothetical protein